MVSVHPARGLPSRPFPWCVVFHHGGPSRLTPFPVPSVPLWNLTSQCNTFSVLFTLQMELRRPSVQVSAHPHRHRLCPPAESRQSSRTPVPVQVRPDVLPQTALPRAPPGSPRLPGPGGRQACRESGACPHFHVAVLGDGACHSVRLSVCH